MRVSIAEVDEVGGQRNALSTRAFETVDAGMSHVAETVTLRDGSTLELTAAVADSNRNLSVFVKHAGIHVLTAAAHWNGVPPYFGVRLANGIFVELLFERA